MIKFKRTRTEVSDPVISIRGGRFNYSSVFSRLAELAKFNYVAYYLDEEKREIGFEFRVDQPDADFYLLGSISNKPNSYRSSAGELINQNPWIKSIQDLRSAHLRNFIAYKRGKLWVIQLRPSFEFKTSRKEINTIPQGLKGIYKYVSTKVDSPAGEIVYIGKGDIKKRLSENNRKAWKFDQVCYSAIQDESAQFEWEHYWINQFKQKNHGRLPYYNNNSGISPKD